MSTTDHERLDKTFSITIILVVFVVLFRLYAFTPTQNQTDFTYNIPSNLTFSSAGGAAL